MSVQRGYSVYPSGFARVSPEHVGTVYKEPDSMACAHYLGMLNGATSIMDSRHFESILRNALALLGTGPDWITLQSMNPNLDKYKVEFLADTVNYIASGKRRMYLATWRELCSFQSNGSVKPIVMNSRVVNAEIKVPAEWLKVHPTEILSKWIAHDGGLVDLIESLHLMFGNPAESGEASR